jgi:hypothetical protein
VLAQTELIDRARDLLGGGTLTVWLVVGGLVALFLAYKAVKLVVRLVAFAVAAVLLLGTAPWSGEPVTGATADCAAAVVAEGAGGWQTQLTKRVTVEELSPDASCNDRGVGLARGSATVKLRTFWDVPFQTWEVTPDGAEARIDLSGEA